MSMKRKPNTAQFKLLKDPTAFLEGGAADKAEQALVASAVVAEAVPRRGRVQKIFNFSEDLAHRLREEALLRSREKGSRVTEKDIVVEALEAFLRRL